MNDTQEALAGLIMRLPYIDYHVIQDEKAANGYIGAAERPGREDWDVDLGIQGKVALCGGGSKGMGRAIAEALGREGCRVVVAARGSEAVADTVRSIMSEGGDAVGVSADMSTREGIYTAVQAARDAYGDPDIAIGNVYGPTHGRWTDSSEQDFEDAYDVMVMSQVHLLRAVTPAMTTRQWGRVVLINSMASKEPHRALPLVTANVTRVAAHALNKSVANELAPYGITINTLGTGIFATERLTSYHERRAAAEGKVFDLGDPELVAEVPMARPGRPEEMADMAVFLASERASYVTGQFIAVDGGAIRSLF